jgi:hypothetical protein
MSGELASQADSRLDVKGVASELLRLVGVLLLGTDILIDGGFAVPAQGYEWLSGPELVVAAVTFIVGSTLPLASSSESRPRTRLILWLVVVLGAFDTIYFAIKHIFGVR